MYSQTFRGLAGFLVDDFFRIPQGTLVARYSKIFATFLTSGLVHMSVDLAIGMAWRESGSVHFACTQVVGICLEDGVQAIYRQYKAYLPPRLEKWTSFIGRIWVGLFLAWSTPVWAYPVLRKGRGREADTIFLSSVGTAAFLG